MTDGGGWKVGCSSEKGKDSKLCARSGITVQNPGQRWENFFLLKYHKNIYEDTKCMQKYTYYINSTGSKQGCETI
jgi:hypothetical protein